MERKWRNLLISLATSIGFIGIIFSFGLGHGILSLLDDEMSGGNIPSQIQISLNTDLTGTSRMTSEDVATIENLVGKDEIKYLEAPFSIMMTAFSIDDGLTFDLTETAPTYSQIVSLYKDSTISMVATSNEDVIGGKLYQNQNEKGVTVTTSMLEDYNQKAEKNYTAKSIIGKKIKLHLIDYATSNSEPFELETTVIRVVSDEIEENNSFMSPNQLETVLKKHQVEKNTPYLMLEMTNPEDTEAVVEKIKIEKRYNVLSQQSVLNTIINFIRIIQALLIVLSSQAIIVSMVMIGVIIYINILQRSREIGVMKTVGYLNRDVKSIFVYESLIITSLSLIIAFVVAAILGIVANLVVKHFSTTIDSIYSLSLVSIVAITLFSFLMGYLSAYLPTRKISKMDPVESLRWE